MSLYYSRQAIGSSERFSDVLSVPDLPTVDRAITIQNGGRCKSETSERRKLGLRTGKERHILFITI